MERFYQTSRKLHTTKMDLNEAVELKIDLQNQPKYKEVTRRMTQRNEKFNRNMATLKVLLFQRENFRVTVFFPMIDRLLTTLQMKLEVYDVASGKSGFLSKMSSVNYDQVRDAAERLVKKYPEHLNTNFSEKSVHFQEYTSEPESGVCLSQI